MKTFEFKSQICTTKEQSERLLALGLKKETADMRWERISEKYAYYPSTKTPYTSSDIPAWSMHRLIELLPKELEINDKKLEFIITYSMDVMLVDERNEEYLTFFADNLYESLVEYAEWLNTKNLLWEDKL